jgi:ABC-type sugar transport system, permease component
MEKLDFVSTGNRKINHIVSNSLVHLIFTMLGILCTLPILLVITASLSDEMDIINYGYSFIPKKLTVNAYITIFMNPSQLLHSYFITCVATIAGTVIGVWLVTTMAYVITRKDYKYRNILSFFIFFTMLFNGGLVPSYILVSRWLHMKDTIFALFVPALFNAFYVLLMKGFLQSIPDSLYESAKLDGAREINIFLRIVLPLSKPAAATVALFYALQFWNDWFLCSFYTDGKQYLTLQTMLIRVLRNLEFLNSAEGRMLAGTQNIQQPLLSARMAICILAAGPMLFVFPFFQKYFVKGLTIGSIKG